MFFFSEIIFLLIEGKHVKTESIITDENIQAILRAYLRSLKDEDRTPARFAKDLNATLLKQFQNAPLAVSEETARRWMIYMKFNATKASKVSQIALRSE